MAFPQFGQHRAKALAVLPFLGILILGATLTRAWESGLHVARPGEPNESYFDGPISFEPNQGQADERVKFMARGPGYAVYFTEQGSRLSFVQRSDWQSAEAIGSVTMKLADETSHVKLVATDPLPTQSSYFTGSDPHKWITGIPNFAQVRFQNAYPGIDVICHGMHGRLEYDFSVAPGALPAAIAIKVAGAKAVQLGSTGDLVIRTARAEVRLEKLAAYQEVGGARHAVSARYVLKKDRISFAVGSYDHSRPLIIDPVLSYAGYLKLQDVRSSGSSSFSRGLK